MRTPVLHLLLLFPALTLAIVRTVSAQATTERRAGDRYQYIRPETWVSPDPRRVVVPPTQAGPEGAVVIRNARIFDGTGGPVRAGTVVIERNRITGILDPRSDSFPRNAQVIDAQGMTALPGLIDLHTHLTYTDQGVTAEQASDEADATLRAVERLRYYLESGITSVRDVASHHDIPFRLKDWVQQRRLAGPRVFPAGKLIVGTGGHGAEGLNPSVPLFGSVREASGPDDWREAVRENFKLGADVIKIASHFSKEEVKAAVEEAHALGLKVTCDCETFYIEWAVEAGADMIEHPLPRSDEAIQLMAARSVGAVPTLVPYDYIFDLSGGYWGSTSRRFTFGKEDNLAMLRRLRAAGIKIGVGTDLVSGWFRYLPTAYIHELQDFVKAGYTPADALVAATRINAELLDMGERLGTLQPGKLADVVIVQGRPDERLEDLAQVRWVIRDGEVVVRDGRVFVPRHDPRPEPTPRPVQDRVR